MALRLFTDNAGTTLSAGIISTDLSLTVPIGDVSRFPTISGLDYFVVTITQAGVETSWEKVKVTGVASNVFTIVRGFDGSAPADWSAGAKVELRDTAIAIQNGANALVPDSSGNINANVIPRTGTLAALQALGGTAGELASATDTPAIVQYTGVPGSASTFYSSTSGLILYNNTATTGSTLGTDGYAELILNVNIATIIITLPQSPVSGQKFVLRNLGANTAAMSLTVNRLSGSANVFTGYLPPNYKSAMEFEYIAAISNWVLHDSNCENQRMNTGNVDSVQQPLTSTALTNNTIATIGTMVIVPTVGSISAMVVTSVTFTLGAGAILSFAEIGNSHISGEIVAGSITKGRATLTGLPANTTEVYQIECVTRVSSFSPGSAAATRYASVRALFTGGTVTASGQMWSARYV